MDTLAAHKGFFSRINPHMQYDTFYNKYIDMISTQWVFSDENYYFYMVSPQFVLSDVVGDWHFLERSYHNGYTNMVSKF